MKYVMIVPVAIHGHIEYNIVLSDCNDGTLTYTAYEHIESSELDRVIKDELPHLVSKHRLNWTDVGLIYTEIKEG